MLRDERSKQLKVIAAVWNTMPFWPLLSRIICSCLVATKAQTSGELPKLSTNGLLIYSIKHPKRQIGLLMSPDFSKGRVFLQMFLKDGTFLRSIKNIATEKVPEKQLMGIELKRSHFHWECPQGESDRYAHTIARNSLQKPSELFSTFAEWELLSCQTLKAIFWMLCHSPTT